MPKPTPAVCEVLPPLPAASVDLDALQAALRVGATGEEAISQAIVAPPAASVAAGATAEPEVPAHTPAPDTPEA